jgi:hypothetical protein
MRAVVAEIVADAQRPENPESDIPDLWSPLVTTPDDEPLRLTPAEGELFLAAMKTIADEYNALTNMRNNLLHATWFIGHPDLPTPFGSEFFVRKFTTTKSGLSALDLPKNAGDLLALAARCDEIAAWIAVLARCVFGVYKIHDAFRKRDDELFLLIEGGETTLPKK